MLERGVSERPPTVSNSYPFWSPRFWHGMRIGDWLKLFFSGRSRIHPSRWGMAFLITLITPWNDLLRGVQWLIHGRKLAKAELAGPPIFILGHWRSGTTLVHELIIKDPRFAYPTTFQCFAPNHFLITEWWFRKLGGWLLPRKRPMDDMDVGWDRPQEDEFALLSLGLPSPYRRMAYCQDPPPDTNYLDWQGVSEADQQHWVDGLRRFLLDISAKTPQPIVLKSPTHTGRIALLARAFPGAKFIHIARDPKSLLPSTMRLWRSLDDVQSLQRPTYSDEALEDYVFECGQRMYRAYFDGKRQVEPDRLVEIRYEELVASPVETLQAVYQKLGLGEFESVKPIHEAWAASQHRLYRTNKHSLKPEQLQRLQTEWSEYLTSYGYEANNLP